MSYRVRLCQFLFTVCACTLMFHVLITPPNKYANNNIALNNKDWIDNRDSDDVLAANLNEAVKKSEMENDQLERLRQEHMQETEPSDAMMDFTNRFRQHMRLANTTKGPVKQFVYHALHKTATKMSRHHLRRFCREYNLTCLTQQDNCLGSISCAANVARLTDTEWDIQYGSYTWTRVMQGCCNAFTQLVVKGFDGVVDHWPLNAEGNKEFLEYYISKQAFRFTLLRDPIDQFLSYWNFLYLKRNETLDRPRQSDIPDLSTFIGLCWNLTQAQSQSQSFTEYKPEIVDSDERILFRIFTNSQSRELGWEDEHPEQSPKENLDQVLNYVTDLDFVGLNENLPKSYEMLRTVLRWSDYWDYNTDIEHKVRGSELRQQLTQDQLKKLNEIQWADLTLYDLAKRLFHIEEVVYDKLSG